jgi:hypothetical protein
MAIKTVIGDEFKNPFRPGAGHMPPYLAGREAEISEFAKLLDQSPILQNVVLTGLRGLGKTVLLETFKPMAMEMGWSWVGTDLSESTSISEEALAIRLMTDLSVVTSNITVSKVAPPKIGFAAERTLAYERLDYSALLQIYNSAPGLVSDKIKSVFETVWHYMSQCGARGIVFAYDEAQNMADHAGHNQFPLSTLLDVFQSIQRRNIPFLLVMTGLPTLFPKLVEARTYAERMFKVIFLEKLDEKSSKEAIVRPIKDSKCPITFNEESVQTVYHVTAGYPYFIQYVCREVFDVWVQNIKAKTTLATIPVDAIIRKLDADFFAGRWARATDRQRELLWVVSTLATADSEFTVQEVAESSGKVLKKPFSSSHTNQLLAQLGDAGLVYKNRHGKYSFAVPLMGPFIRRVMGGEQQMPLFSSP